MKTVLTHGYFLEEDEKEKLIMKPYPPLGILCVSAFLEQHGIANEVYDSTFSSFSRLCNYLEQEQPQLIGIYTNLMTKLNVLRLLAVYSQPSILNPFLCCARRTRSAESPGEFFIAWRRRLGPGRRRRKHAGPGKGSPGIGSCRFAVR
jgi:hypothetical protein